MFKFKGLELEALQKPFGNFTEPHDGNLIEPLWNLQSPVASEAGATSSAARSADARSVVWRAFIRGVL